MDKLQQYYESLPLCTGNTPGNVMFSVYNDIDNLDSLTRWFDLPDDEAYNKVPNLTFQRTGLPDAFAGYPCIAVLFFENRAGDDPFFREHRATFRQMYLGEFYQFNLSSCIRQQNSLTAQFVSFSLANLANIFYPPPIFTIINLCLL